MPVSPIFALGSPSGGDPTALTYQPTSVRPISAPRVGNRDSGIVQHGRNAIQASWTESIDGSAYLLDTVFAELNAQFVASNATAGERKIIWYDPDASSGAGGSSGTIKCLMDRPEWVMLGPGVYGGVTCVFRDLGRP